MEFVFARHGHSTANEQRIISNRNLPHDLTDRGRTQAHTLRERLAAAGMQPVSVYTSPIPRARQTAQILAGEGAIESSDALREIDCGVIEGRGDDDAWAIHDAIEGAWGNGQIHARVEGGESLVDVQARFVPFVQAVVDRHRSGGGITLLVSDGTVLLEMLPRLLANLDFGWARASPLGNCDIVRVEPRGHDLMCTSWAGTDPPRAVRWERGV